MRWGKYGISSRYSTIRLDLKLPFRINIYFVFLFIATSMLLTSPLVINNAFAINAYVIKNPYENNLPTELKWQMVFISSDSACSNYHYQMMATYYDATIEYLKLYALDNISYDPLCITEEKYLSNYENPSDLDLLILVYDEDLGEKELHANQMGGLYTHSGTDRTQNHVIIICDCPNFDYSSPVWVLSHELSHFILYYKNFEMSVIERLIHVNDVKYDQCLEESTTCKSSSIKMMAGPGGYLYSVMPIYQPAVGVTENIVDNVNPYVPSEVTKIITEWWATGVISDAQFSNAIGYLVDSNSVSSNDGTTLILTDEPLDNTITWEQMMEEITPTYWAHEPKSDDDSMAYLSKIPSSMISNDKNPLLKERNFGLPEWFKETASLWGQDMITNTEFNKNLEYLVEQGIIESHTSGVFQDLTVESVPMSQQPTSLGSLGNEQNNNELLPQTPASEEPSTIRIESVPENTPVESVPENTPVESVPENTPVELEEIHKLYEFANTVPGIDNTIMVNLETAVTSYNDGNINDTCNNLGNFLTMLENLIDSNKISQSLGHLLIAEGELVKLDLCN